MRDGEEPEEGPDGLRIVLLLVLAGIVCLFLFGYVQRDRLSSSDIPDNVDQVATVLRAYFGEARSQYTLGTQAQHRGDEEEALYWYRKAASGGHRPALRQLAIRFLKEEAEPRDDLELFDALMAYARSGNADAQTRLCMLATYGPPFVLQPGKQTVAWCGGERMPLVLDFRGPYVPRGKVYYGLIRPDFENKTFWLAHGERLLLIETPEGLRLVAGRIDGESPPNAFVVLAEHDSDGNGRITPEDESWPLFRVWTDSDLNGEMDEGELGTLDDLEITAIDLSYTNEPQRSGPSQSFQHGRFFRGDREGRMATVLFGAERRQTRYAGDYTPVPEAAGLPDLPGAGWLPDIHIALSLEAARGGERPLLDALQVLAGIAETALFLPETNLPGRVRSLLFRWAGVTDVSPGDRGPNVDARELGFIEAVNGEDFFERGIRYEPRPYLSAPLAEVFDAEFRKYYALLAAQLRGGALLDGDVRYNPQEQRVESPARLDRKALARFAAHAGALPTPAEKDAFWRNVVMMLEGLGLLEDDRLPAGDIEALDRAIAAAGGTVPSLAAVREDIKSPSRQ